MIKCLFACLLLFGISASANHCALCRKVLEKYCSTFYEIDPDTSLGGGNSDWEKKNIGRYAFSELHAFETLEKTMTSLNDREANFLSEIDDDIENYWAEKLKTGQSKLGDIINVLCIDKLNYCCPWNKFGPECFDCDPCHVDKGSCDGNGTRTGTGICNCRAGFSGTSCEKCNSLTHFQSVIGNKEFDCVPCHPSCAGGCSDESPNSCVSCAKGYDSLEIDGVKICEDIDECSDGGSRCEVGKYCVNTVGSFSCVKCPKECATCSSHSICSSCLSGYTLTDTECVDINECSLPNSCPGDHKRCVNRPGSYGCVCEKGYRSSQGVCVSVPPSHKSSRHSSKTWSYEQANHILIEFAKLILILIVLGIFLYFLSNRPIVCSSLALVAVGLICYQTNALDALHLDL